MNLISRHAGLIADDTSPARWRFGAVELDERDESVHVDGAPIPVDRCSFDLLRCLVRSAGETVSKDDLLRAGWPGRVVTENSLVKAIGRVRQLLGNTDGERLRVVHGYGYRLVASVERMSEVPPAAPGLAQQDPLAAPPPAPPVQRPRLNRITIAALLALFAAAAVATSVTLLRSPARAPDPLAPLSLAVLPFVDMSAAHDQTYFSDGLTEQLLNDLSRLPQLQLAARTSSFAYRDKQADIRTIGRELHVATVLEGSVRKSAERIRVTVQLINAADGYHLWSTTYDRPVAELFAMEDEITRAIVSALRIELLPEQLKSLAQRGTNNPDAYEEYLLAHNVFQDDETAHRRAIAHYERAVQLDPKFIDAWLALADLLSFSGLYADNAEDALAGKRRAMEIADRVIALAPDNADAYFLRAERKFAHWWDWSGARADLELGKARSSADAESYLRVRCRLEAALGDLHTAIALAHRVTELNPSSGWAWSTMGYHYTALGEFERAHDALTQAVRAQPLDEHAH